VQTLLRFCRIPFDLVAMLDELKFDRCISWEIDAKWNHLIVINHWTAIHQTSLESFHGFAPRRHLQRLVKRVCMVHHFAICSLHLYNSIWYYNIYNTIYNTIYIYIYIINI
jgi:hypothetical protein